MHPLLNISVIGIYWTRCSGTKIFVQEGDIMYTATTIRTLSPDLMRIDPIATGRQLRKMRILHSLTQEELSAQFDSTDFTASRNIISQWETGKKLPSMQHVVGLSELYCCRIDELVISVRRALEASEDRDQPVPFQSQNCIYKANVCESIHSPFFVNLRCAEFKP